MVSFYRGCDGKLKHTNVYLFNIMLKRHQLRFVIINWKVEVW